MKDCHTHVRPLYLLDIKSEGMLLPVTERALELAMAAAQAAADEARRELKRRGYDVRPLGTPPKQGRAAR